MSAVDALVAYFTGPMVTHHSVYLGIANTPSGRAARAFFDTRNALGIRGYPTADEARRAINVALNTDNKRATST